MALRLGLACLSSRLGFDGGRVRGRARSSSGDYGLIGYMVVNGCEAPAHVALGGARGHLSKYEKQGCGAMRDIVVWLSMALAFGGLGFLPGLASRWVRLGRGACVCPPPRRQALATEAASSSSSRFAGLGHRGCCASSCSAVATVTPSDPSKLPAPGFVVGRARSARQASFGLPRSPPSVRSCRAPPSRVWHAPLVRMLCLQATY